MAGRRPVRLASLTMAAVVKPPMAKIANVFGRLEAFSFSIFLYVVGYIQMAASQNVQTFASAQIFYSAGFTGLQILQQIFIADTSDLLNRALFSSLPDVPFLVTVWVGPPIAQNLLTYSSWRWGYGLWAIVLPAAFLPLAVALFANLRKASKQGVVPPRPWHGVTPGHAIRNTWLELDVGGLLLLSAAIALVLLPLTLAVGLPGQWANGKIITMFVVGGLCLIAFPIWESSKIFAPWPFLSLRLLRNVNVLAGCGIGFCYFGASPPLLRSPLTLVAAFYMSIFPYFSSYLQVVQGDSVTAAGHITQTFSFTSTVAALVISLIIKYTKHYKYYITAGSAIYLMGIGLMIRYRSEGSTTAQIVGTQIAVGIGGGMLNVPTQLGVQAAVSHSDVAAATAIYLTVVEIGGAVGAAISGAIWTANLPAKLQAYIPSGSQIEAESIFANLTLATSFAEGSEERRGVDRAYQETMDLLLIGAVCWAAVPFLLSFLMRNYKLDKVPPSVVSAASSLTHSR